MSVPFVHLHCHTAYSLLDGAIRLPELMEQVKEMGMAAVAMTDHGNLFGAVNFYKQAEKAGVKPIIGCEMYVAPGDRRVKESRPGQEVAHHLILLARNLTGYHNLVRLVSAAYLEGFYYKPRIDLELLAEHCQGLIATSACLHGAVSHFLLAGQEDKALEAARTLAALMGEGNFFLEVQNHGLPEQEKVLPGIVDIAGRLGLGMVATNDCHYLKREHYQAHEALLCIQTGKTLGDQNRMSLSREVYFKPPQAMAELFGDYEGALANTVEIAERCNLELELGRFRFPRFPLDNGERAEERLRRDAEKGLERRVAELEARGRKIDREHYRQRLEYELSVLAEMEYADYFLVVADFINWAKGRGIPVGPGRGSAAGSLVAFSLRITDLDPIRYGLIFERFLNRERVSMPDIDVDFCYDRRGEVLEYVAQKYGPAQVAQIITFGSMQARAVIRDVGRVQGLPYNEVDQIAKLVPAVLGITLEQALEREPRLRERMKSDETVRELIEIALVLEGLPRHASTHAAGVVIGDEPLNQVVPLYRTNRDETVTQFDMKGVEEIGLIKFDFLGLRTLTVIDHAVRLVQRGPDPDFSIEGADLADPATYELLSRGDTTGVFQLESSGMKELLTKMRPECFEDIIALVALYRPGPLESGMVDDFVARKHGKRKVTHLLDELEPVLKETYGVIVYQEQVMEIARILAGYSLGEGDILRKAMGKKIPQVMAQQEGRFVQGAIKHGIPKKSAQNIFKLIEQFAGYGFNKAHSAAYALIAFQTAYLKAHFPLQFMAAVLTSEADNTDKVMRHVAECREHGLKVLPPEVNSCGRDFTVAQGAIRFGLAAVKNVGAGAVAAILAARDEGGPFGGLLDFCERVDLRRVNRRVIESLIKCGAFDSTGAHRSQLMAVLDESIESGQRLGRDREGGQANMFAAFGSGDSAGEPPLPAVPPWSERDLLAYEKEALGFYITSHPLARYKKDVARLSSLDTVGLAAAGDGQKVRIAGLPTEVKEKITKKGDLMAFVRLEDLRGSAEVICFPDCYQEAAPYLKGEEPILVSGLTDANEQGVKLKADKIVPLEKAAGQMTRSVRIRLTTTSLERDKMVALRQALERHRGSCRVYLHLGVPGSGEAVLALPGRYRVAPEPEMITEVNQMFGHAVVETVLEGE